MENKNIEKDFNLLNIKIKLKKLTIAEIEAAQKGSSQKVLYLNILSHNVCV